MTKARDLSQVPNASLGFKNRILNGQMQIDQRNAGASVTLTSVGSYTVDRWIGFEDTDGSMTAQQSSVAPAGFTNSLLCTTTTADASLGATQFSLLVQRIEGFNIADLGWGTANAQPVTLSFWVRSSLTGTFGGAFNNGSFNRYYPFSYTINSANTWEQKTITVPGDTTGTWFTTNGSGIQVNFGLGVGSTYSGTAGSWGSSILYSVTGATSVIGTSGATFYITGVMLEKGSTATSYDYRPYGTELSLCQRYFQFVSSISTGGGSTNFILGRNRGAANEYDAIYRLSPTMRASPTVSFESGMRMHFPGVAVSAATYSTLSGAITESTVAVRGIPASDYGSAAYQGWIDGDGTNPRKILFSAEL